MSSEKLELLKRKAEIKKGLQSYNRSLSSFAYSYIQQTIRTACYRAGIEVIPINPAYTSTIGAINFSQRLGISIHQGAALAIARRGLGFSERPADREVGILPTPNGGHVTFFLPERNRKKHVWSLWAGVNSRLKVAHAAHIRSGGLQSITRGSPAPLRQPPDGESPALGATWIVPVRLRHANRQQNCSVGVMDDVPW